MHIFVKMVVQVSKDVINANVCIQTTETSGQSWPLLVTRFPTTCMSITNPGITGATLNQPNQP